MIHYPNRVAMIREKAAAYSKRISDLEARVKDAGFVSGCNTQDSMWMTWKASFEQPST